MKTIIAGSREITDYQIILDAVKESEYTITEVISGGARGVDNLGERFAKENNIKLTVIKAEWDKFGKSAGYKRNLKMAEYVGNDGALIAVPLLGKSVGTYNMISIARKNGLKIFIKEIKNDRI